MNKFSFLSVAMVEFTKCIHQFLLSRINSFRESVQSQDNQHSVIGSEFCLMSSIYRDYDLVLQNIFNQH
jgi:hypothetical protein